MTPNLPHWSIYTCPQVDEPEALCDYRAASVNFNYIFARACHIKVSEPGKRVFIRRTDVRPFNQEQRFLQDVAQLEVLSFLYFGDFGPLEENSQVVDTEKNYPF